MKKINFLIVALLCAAMNMFATEVSNITVPEDYSNDLWMDVDFKELTLGTDTFSVIARRVPEIVESLVSNVIAHPTYTYEVVEGASVSVAADGKVTTLATGRSLIKVGYDATTQFGKNYAAISPINMGYMVIDVVEESLEDITISTTLDDVKTYDTYYYKSGDAFDLPFDVTVDGASSFEVYCNSVKLTKNEAINKYTASLENRANVIEVVATNAVGKTKRYAKSIDARRIDIKIENKTNPESKAIRVGDKIHISFKGIVPAIYKLAGTYNPYFVFNPEWATPGAEITHVKYHNEQLGDVKSNYQLSQYNIDTKNTIELTMTEAGEYIFNDGFINCFWYGSKLGSEKGTNMQAPPNLAAGVAHAELSKMPAFRIFVQPALEDLEDAKVLDVANMTNDAGEAIVFDETAQNWVNTYSAEVDDAWIKDENFRFSHLRSGENWGGSYWEGFTVSKSTDNAYDHEDFPNRQWGAMTQGGIAGVGTPYVQTFYSFFGGSGNSCEIQLLSENARTVQGTYVTSTPYVAKCIYDGFFVARPFHQGDYLTITAHGLVTDADTLAYNDKSVTFYAADYRSENPQNWMFHEDWQWMDLTALGDVNGVYFTMESTDSGDFGANTAFYFALDGLTSTKAKIEVPTSTNEIESAKAVIYSYNQNIFVNGAEAGAPIVVYSINGTMLYNGVVSSTAEVVSVSYSGMAIVKVANQVVKITL